MLSHTYSVPVDSWEISPDCIIMDTMLGEGQFGASLGLIKDGDVFVCVCVHVTVLVYCCNL